MLCDRAGIFSDHLLTDECKAKREARGLKAGPLLEEILLAAAR